MTTTDILRKLESLGTEQTKKTWMRHGAKEPFFGVKIEDMKNLIKEIKRSVREDPRVLPYTTATKMHQHALDLYATGNSDAMYMAGLMADPKQFDKATLQKWAEQAYWYMLSEFTVPWMAAESPLGWELANEWIANPNETIASAGWATFSGIVAITPDDKLDIGKLVSLLSHIEKNIHQSPNRVRHTMNSFIISVGCYVKELTNLCKSTALSIGKVSVNMGDTACKVAYAPDYISKNEMMGRIGKKKKTLVC